MTAPMGKTKGMEGDHTGATARKLIQELMDRGLTHEEIGSKVNRSAGVIGAILNGEIHNPPSDLIDALKKLVETKFARKFFRKD